MGNPLKAVWKDCSKVSSDYDEEVAESKWAGFCQPDSNFSGKKISFGTICRHAKEDDPEGFAQKQLAGRSVQHRIRFALQTGGSHVAVAKVLHAVLGEQLQGNQRRRKAGFGSALTEPAGKPMMTARCCATLLNSCIPCSRKR